MDRWWQWAEVPPRTDAAAAPRMVCRCVLPSLEDIEWTLVKGTAPRASSGATASRL